MQYTLGIDSLEEIGFLTSYFQKYRIFNFILSKIYVDKFLQVR